MAMGLPFHLVDHGRNRSLHVNLFQKKEVAIEGIAQIVREKF